VRFGIIGSVIFHIVVFGLVIFNFVGTSKNDTPPPPVAVEIMSPKDYSERQAGKTDGKADVNPTPPADIKAPDAQATAKTETEQKPAPKPAEKEALAPPPPKAPDPAPPAPPKPVEQAKVEPPPEKPVEKPVPKPVVKPVRKPVPKPKPKLEEAKRLEEAEPKRIEPRPAPDRQFDPNRIASILKKDQDQDEHAPSAESMMNTPPSKTFSDRQTAVLNRDPNAGTPGGDYEPGKPWRPSSSLQDQAMGLPQARGQMNAGSCADLVQSRIEQNWDLPIGAVSAENTVVRLRIELNRDGSLLHPPTIMDSSFSPGYQAMADAAVRAAIRGQPYNVPPEQYERCRDMVLRFNPRDMYGG
jgi:outer membrane biosynthesis protein TonB